MSSENGNKKDRRRLPYIYLGVDGGGTKTTACLINAAREPIGEGTAGPSNPLRVGVESAVSNIAKAIELACDESGASRLDIVSATLGLAGVRREDIRERVRDSFVRRLGIRKTTVLTDAEIALYGTTLGKAGIVVIAGTGSVCLGKNDDGDLAISGGWGPLAGDEGGGVSIAQAALHQIAKASDGRGTPTSLSERASEYFRASTPENLIVAIYSPHVDNSRIAGFAKYVVDAAREGDTVALEILNDAGRELGVAACAVINKLGLNRRKIPIGCVGSIFKAGELVTRPMAETIRSVAPKAVLTDPQMSPAQAAAYMSLKNASVKPRV